MSANLPVISKILTYMQWRKKNEFTRFILRINFSLDMTTWHFEVILKVIQSVI